MAIRVFNLNNVPDDELEEVRDLFNQHHIDFYETPAGRWGISSPALWIKDKRQHPQVKKLLAEYAVERATRKRAEYDQLKKEGRHKTALDLIREKPFFVAMYVAILALIVYFSTLPFVHFFK
ncbi:MAG TPA: hypothetical protein ENJ07_04855 [Gammaproteobacteria bacterium]|nr:hypothetical protein [Gammaproteobacteria bacterium]